MKATNDLFEEFGESLTPQWKKRAEAKAAARAAKAPMVKHGLEKEQIEKAKQLVRYRQWKAEVREGMSRGDYGIEIIELLKHLRHPSRITDLVNYILSAEWLLKCSLETRATLLGYIDHALVRHQVRNGYPPFDDAILDEPRTPFLVIRYHLTGV